MSINRFSFLFLLLLVSLSSGLYSQVNDYTPPGDWKSLQPKALGGGEYIQITAISVDDITLTYLLIDDELLLLEPDSSLATVTYLEHSNGAVFFLTQDDQGLSHIIYIDDGEIHELPNDRNWSVYLTPRVLSDGSLIASFKDVDTDLIHPVVISQSNFEVLNTPPYKFVNMLSSTMDSRMYYWGLDTSTIGFSGSSILGYYDVEDGNSVTDIPLTTLDVISNNPGDSIHVLIINGNVDTIDSKIYRVVDHTFNEISVPGGPYDDIQLLYRNDDTGTSLFEMKDYGGNVKFIKRQMGSWSDLTSSLPNFEDIAVEFSIDSEVFLDVRLLPGEQQFWYFQSTSIGDTLINVTPPGGPYDYINYFRSSMVPFPSFEFEAAEGEYIYTYFNGLTTLIAPTYQLVNPEGEPAKSVNLLDNGILSFDYYNIDSSVTYNYLYHQTAPGGALSVLSENIDVDRFVVCSAENFVLFKSYYFEGSEELFHYNLDSTVKITFPERDSAEVHELTSFGAEGCMLEKQTDDVDSSVFTYTFINGRLIDITHPRWRNFDTDDNKDYQNKELISYVSNIEDESLKRLWGVTYELRGIDFCNSDLKFFQDEAGFPIGPKSIPAEKIFLGTRLIHLDNQQFNVSESFELVPGAIVESTSGGMNVSVEDCINGPSGQ